MGYTRLRAASLGGLGSLLLTALAWGGNPAHAAGNYDKGAQKAFYCAYCHGYDGNSTDEKIPRLAGQPVEYITGRIKELKKNGGLHPEMEKVLLTGDLTEADIANLATYYSRQKASK